MVLVRKLLASGLLFFLLSSFGASARDSKSTLAATSFVFIDTQYIWTLEIVLNPYDRPIPILNVITLTRGEWDFRPIQVSLVNPAGRVADIERFSMDTGEEGNPYLTNYLKVLGNSFIGVDLTGDLEEFRELSEVRIELGNNLFRLAPVHPAAFESLVAKINQVNVDSPDIREDFQVLGIFPIGEKEVLNRVY